MEPDKNTSVFLKHYDRSNWERVRLGDIVEYKKGNGLSKEKLSSKGEHECVLYGELFTRYKETIDYVFSKTSYKEGELSVLGDVLMPGSTTTCGEDLAKASAIHHDNVLLGGDIVILRPNNNLLDGDFLAYLIPSYRNELIKYTQGITIIHLQGKKILDMMICIPDMATQKNIVKDIQTIDVHISDLETLISKQKAIKKSTLKLLLAPQSNWAHTNIGSLVTVLRGESLQSKNFVSGNIPVVAGGVGIAGYHNKSNRPGNTITISASGANAGFINFYKEPIFATDCSTISETNSLDTLFLYYVLKSKQDSIFKMQTGGAQPHVHPKDISRINIYIPDLDVQQQIAGRLQKLDQQLEHLQSELDKYRNIKNGLMDYFFG